MEIRKKDKIIFLDLHQEKLSQQRWAEENWRNVYGTADGTFGHWAARVIVIVMLWLKAIGPVSKQKHGRETWFWYVLVQGDYACSQLGRTCSGTDAPKDVETARICRRHLPELQLFWEQEQTGLDFQFIASFAALTVAGPFCTLLCHDRGQPGNCLQHDGIGWNFGTYLHAWRIRAE